jgi:glycosyltransferase involved in cell wall biosynthesis
VTRGPGPDVAVIIPVLDGAHVIGRQLEALCAQKAAPPFEVIVADNGSRDDLRGVVGAFQGRLDVRVIDASAVTGASHARNRGAAATGARYLLFCDADDVVSLSWVRALADALGNGAAQATGPVLYVSAPPAAGERVRRRIPTSPRRFMGRVPFGLSGNLGLTADLFARLDGFDEALKRSEDADLTIRAALAEEELVWVQESLIFTVVRPTVSSSMRQFFWYGMYDVALERKLYGKGLSRRSISQQIRPYLGLLGRVHWLLTASGRRSWLTKASQHAGRLCGSVRFAWWCP